MNGIKEQIRHYLVFFDLKSSIKTEECQGTDLKTDLEKLKNKVFELSCCVDALKWKINRAEFIFSCEKMRHRFFYNLTETSADSVSKEYLFHRYRKCGSTLRDYKVCLQEEKADLIKQLEELQNNK